MAGGGGTAGDGGSTRGAVGEAVGSGDGGDSEPALTREEWLRAFCERVGVEPPSAEEVDALLELAAVAAHASERPAAPLACWAAGKTGRSPAELRDIAREVAP